MVFHSVVICTLDRPASLKRCLDSLDVQTVKPEEIILITERGVLTQLRNEGARHARGFLLSFLDDDVVCVPQWSAEVRAICDRDARVVGVSGPAVIPLSQRSYRDLFRYRWIKRVYDTCFADGRAHLPGHLTRAGTWTTGACEETCTYEGPVDFLEACNQTWRTEAFWSVGGYDEAYGGIGDWSEPDLALRVRAKTGGVLWFSPRAGVTHYPDRTGAYLAREQVGARLTNYDLFSRRWITPCWRHTMFKGFLRTYYGIKQVRSWWRTNVASPYLR